MSIHREENVDSPKNFNNLLAAIEAISNKYNMPIIISTHPRTKNRIEKNKIIIGADSILVNGYTQEKDKLAKLFQNDFMDLYVDDI